MFKYVKYALLILSIFVFGCQRNYEYPDARKPAVPDYYGVIDLQLDNSFTDDQIDILQEAVNEWNYVLNGTSKFEISRAAFSHQNPDEIIEQIEKSDRTQHGLPVIGINSNDPINEKMKEDSLAFVAGLGRHAKFMLIFKDRVFNKGAHRILMHELGHVLGANHVNTESLMFPYYHSGKQAGCIDKITALQVSTYWNIPFNKMRYCKLPNLE